MTKAKLLSKRPSPLRKSLIGILCVLLTFTIIFVSAFVYEQASLTVTQTIKEIATLTLQNSALGDIEEGETKSYNKTEVSSLGNIINITTTKANVYLHFNSDLDTLNASYGTYNITVKFIAVPAGSILHSVGDTATTLTLASPNYSSVDLDAVGDWRFDFEITTTANSVNSDTPTTVTITVSAESTSS